MGDPLDGLPDLTGQPFITDGPELRTICISAHIPAPMRRDDTWCLEDFDLHKELYRGKTSLLYSATERKSGMHVALKLYRKRKLSILNKYQVSREIRIHSSLDNENIIKLYVAFEDEKNVYMVQEFAGSGDLFEDLKRHGGQMKESHAVKDVICPFLNAITYMHSQGIIHRDIKPENILLTADRVIKVADFGLSINFRQERPVTRAGTLDYMAPEVLVCPDKRKPEENKDKAVLAYTTQVDSWATGILAYELLVGYPPFEQESRAATYEHIMYKDPKFPAWMSEGAKSFITQALCKNASKRVTASELRNHPWLLQSAPRPAQSDPPTTSPHASRLGKSASSRSILSKNSSSPFLNPNPASNAPSPSVMRSYDSMHHALSSSSCSNRSSSFMAPALAVADAARAPPPPTPPTPRSGMERMSPGGNSLVRLQSLSAKRLQVPPPVDVNMDALGMSQEALSAGISPVEGGRGLSSPQTSGGSASASFFRPKAGVLSDDSMCPSPLQNQNSMSGAANGIMSQMTAISPKAVSPASDSGSKYTKLFSKMWRSGQAPPSPTSAGQLQSSSRGLPQTPQTLQPPQQQPTSAHSLSSSGTGCHVGDSPNGTREQLMSRSVKMLLKGVPDEAKACSRTNSFNSTMAISRLREDSMSIARQDSASQPVGMNCVEFKLPNNSPRPHALRQLLQNQLSQLHLQDELSPAVRQHSEAPVSVKLDLGYEGGARSFTAMQPGMKKIAQGAIAQKIETYMHGNK